MQMIKNPEACARFGLKDGQFFAYQQHKNLHWFLDDVWIGFGDIRGEDIERIQAALTEGEVFKGYDENHMTRWMKRENEVIKITTEELEWPGRVMVTPETRKKIYEEWGP